jgi:type I restriction enzyme, S subunit
MSEVLPCGWFITELNETVQILDTFRKPISGIERSKRIKGKEDKILFPYYGATGQVGLIDDFLLDGQFILLGEDGAPFLESQKNKAYKVYGKIWVNNHAHILNSLLSNEFLLYFLNQFDYTGFVTGTTRLKLNQSSLKKIPFKCPPLNEQKRIAAKLDQILPKIEGVKERMERIPQIIKRFRQSVLNASVTGNLTEKWRDEQSIEFDWEENTIDSIIDNGPQNGIYKAQEYYGKGCLIVRIDNFYDGIIQPWETLKRLKLTKNELEIYKLRNKDILINRVNSMAYLGKSGLVNNLKVPCVFESNMMRISVNEELVLSEYLILYLNCQIGLLELRKNAKHAVNQSSINQQDVKSVLIPLPPLEEQKEIIRQVDKLFTFADKLEEHYQKAKEKTDKFPQSVLAKAFRGELVPQDPNDEPAEKLLERIKKEKARLGFEINQTRKKTTKKAKIKNV